MADCWSNQAISRLFYYFFLSAYVCLLIHPFSVFIDNVSRINVFTLIIFIEYNNVSFKYCLSYVLKHSLYTCIRVNMSVKGLWQSIILSHRLTSLVHLASLQLRGLVFGQYMFSKSLILKRKDYFLIELSRTRQAFVWITPST